MKTSTADKFYIVHFKTIMIATIFVFFIIGCYPKRIGPMINSTGKKMTWEEMNINQRIKHMRDEVLPRAKKIFRSWRPEHYKKIDCSLCHGQVVNEGHFKMP